MYRIMPRCYKRKVENWFKTLDIKTEPSNFFNYSFATSFATGFIIAMIAKDFFFIVWISVFLGMLSFFHGLILLSLDRRIKFVEEILPDALQLMSANIRAGYIPSMALMLSTRKEFGPLSKAIKKSGKEIMTGKSLEDGLAKIPEYINSKELKRVIGLIIEGIKGGGQIMSLLEENATDIRRRQSIRKEIKASILMYVIFIVFAGCVGAPALYALSGYLINTIGGFRSMANLPESFSTSMPLFKFGSMDVTPDFIYYFSLISIVITSTFSGLIVGMINTGKATSGIKYIPIFLSISLSVFFLANYAVNNLLSGMIPTI